MAREFSLPAMICGLSALALVYSCSIVSLQNDAKVCRRDEINTLTNVTVLANVNGEITVALSPQQNCTYIVVGGSVVQPGTNVFIYRSENGGCDIVVHDDKCSEPVTTFAWLYTIFGAFPTYAAVAFAVDYLVYLYCPREGDGVFVMGPYPQNDAEPRRAQSSLVVP